MVYVSNDVVTAYRVLTRLQIRFLGDPSVAFTKELDLSFDGASVFGGDRSKRYALVIEDGKVKEAHVEPDNTGLNGMFYLRNDTGVGEQTLTSISLCC